MHHRLCSSGHETSTLRPSCSFLIADNIPLWRSWRTHTLGLSQTTARLMSEKNHNQLSAFSDSTKAKAIGTTLSFASTPMQVSSCPLYNPVKNVPSTQRTGLQCLKASMMHPKDQKARLSTFSPFAS